MYVLQMLNSLTSRFQWNGYVYLLSTLDIIRMTEYPLYYVWQKLVEGNLWTGLTNLHLPIPILNAQFNTIYFSYRLQHCMI